MNIIFVAPYEIPSNGKGMALGAANKIASIAQILSSLAENFLFINSAHISGEFDKTKRSPAELGGKTHDTIYPFSLKNRKLGKLCNAIFVDPVTKIAGKFSPDWIWIYNGYMFEARIAAAFKKLHPAMRIAMEIEDWPMSRTRSFNPKPYLDFLAFQKILPAANLITCVNESIMARSELANRQKILLPSVISELVNSYDNKGGTLFSGECIRFGYFGGLSKEKGVDIVLRAIESLPAGMKLVMTGSGPLSIEISNMARRWPERLEFHGIVSEAELYRLMGSCDALLNPHKSIVNMDQGVFPFKVFEYLSTSKLLITTDLPPAGIEFGESVLYFDGTSAGLIERMSEARNFYLKRTADIARTADAINATYSYAAIRERLKAILESKD